MLAKLRMSVAVLRLLRVMRAPGTLEEKVDRAFRHLRPAQVREEVLALAHLVAERGWDTIVEIGRAEGGTLYVLASSAPPRSLVVSVDVVEAGPVTRMQLSRLAPGRRVAIVAGDSGDEATLARVRRILGDRRIGFLFIDGDHSYEGVRRDYELWSPLVGTGGAIGFHDIRPGPGSGDVHRFWAELEGEKRELVAEPGQTGYGIGVLER